jgi:hypothetical protein
MALLIPSRAQSALSFKANKFKSSSRTGPTEVIYYYFLDGELFDMGTLDNKKVILHGMYLLNRHQTKQFANIKMGKNDKAIFITTEGSAKGKELEIKLERMKLQNITNAVNKINEALKQHAEDSAI